MKKQLLSYSLTAILLTGLTFSCKKKETSPAVDDSPAPGTTGGTTGGINTGALNLFVVDTAKINTISETGSNETTIINKTINSSSFIPNLSLAPDGARFVYAIYQQAPFSGTVQGAVSREIRIADKTGANDALLHGINTGTVDFGCVRFGNNNKIYFTKDTYYPNISHTFCSINADGSGFQSATTYYNIDDISSDGAYYLTHATNTGTYTSFTVIDKAGDNGAGSQLMAVNVSTMTSANFAHGVFTNDTKKVVIPYQEGLSAKVLILDLVNKTSSIKTLVNNLPGSYATLIINLASDSNRGVLTVSGYQTTVSNSYIFDLSAGTILKQFANNDKFVEKVHCH